MPKDLTETFKRALRRITAQRNADVASKSFRWVAAAKRPLSVDELREAIFIEIGQEYSRPERFPNGIHNIGSWCENLINVDEEKNIVQFAHHTVRQFLISKDSDPELENFHCEADEADHYLGEICVTYLNFNNFKTTLARRPRPPPQIIPAEIAHQALRNEKGSTNLLRTMARFASGASRKSVTTNVVDVISSLTSNDAMVDKTESEHPFLKYASKYMILHTKNFEEKRSVMWIRWKEMMIYGSDLIETPYGVKSLMEDDLCILDWSLSARHHALLRLIYLGLGSSSSEDRASVLWEVASRGQVDVVKLLLDAGADVHSSKANVTALRAAFMNSYFSVAEALLLAGADLNMPDENGQTALHQAARCGYLKIVEKLLDLGADVNLRGWNRLTALHQAAGGQHLDIVDRLLAAGADINMPGFLGQPVLFQAIQLGRHRFFKKLLDRGANVNIRATHGETALYYAVKSGNMYIVQRLLEAGAYVNTSTFGDNESPLHRAVEDGNVAIVQRLVGAGADVNTATRNIETPLHFAIKDGNIAIIQGLIEAGANVNTETRDGETPLHFAVKGGNVDIVQRLLKAGAYVNPVTLDAKGKRGPTALQIAITHGHQDIAEILKRAGGH